MRARVGRGDANGVGPVEHWVFVFVAENFRDECYLRLSSYGKYERPSKRHKFRRGPHWEPTRTMLAERLKREDVPLPDDVLVEARMQIVQMVSNVEVKL